MSGIRTHDPGFRESEDSAYLRPLGYRDRLLDKNTDIKCKQLFITEIYS
jgi:hypothetical protein